MYVPLSLLKRHVLESNRIEQITQRSGVALVRSHLNAAVQVARRSPHELLDPLQIHRWLTRDTCMERLSGQVRECAVWVGIYTMPKWEEVPRLLDEWRGLVIHYDQKMKASSKKDRVRIARILHELLLCVHPFEDGNGRTSRLVLNMLRLRWGLSWLVIESRKKGSYYRRIEHTEETIFRVRYPDVFPEYLPPSEPLR